MQAHRQNTRQLAALQTERLEWWTYGPSWSLVNYGPGRLWFNYSGEEAIVGMPNSTELRSGFSFTKEDSSVRFMELSLQAVEPLTYSLITNQRIETQAGIDEAPVDGFGYLRQDAGWNRLNKGWVEVPSQPQWVSWQLAVRTIAGGEQMHLVGNLQRGAGQDIPPNLAFVITNLDAPFRPRIIQYGVCACAFGTALAGTAVLRLQSNGQLEVYVSAATLALYLNNIFDLSLTF